MIGIISGVFVAVALIFLTVVLNKYFTAKLIAVVIFYVNQFNLWNGPVIHFIKVRLTGYTLKTVKL